MIAILGGGISGISAGYHLGLKDIENTVYEKRESWGGLCDNFTIGDGFRFDYFIHLSFTSSDYVKNLFSKSSDVISHHPDSSNYYKGYWLKHPVQNNLAPLTPEEKTEIIIDFINRPVFDKPKHYKEWLFTQFGEYFTNNFPGVYTRKYWTIEAEELTTDWLNGRFSLPPLANLLKGAFKEQDENFYYAHEMRYPKQGGYKSFLKVMASKCKIQTQKEAVLIDLKSKRIDFTDNTFVHYDKLVSSLPLPELVARIKDVPKSIIEASEKLLWTSGQLVSIGFNRPDIPKNIWFYIYDEDILPARVYSPSIKSPDNVPEGKSSLQFETYYSKMKAPLLKGDALIKHIISRGDKIGLFSTNDITVNLYGNEQSPFSDNIQTYNLGKADITTDINFLKECSFDGIIHLASLYLTSHKPEDSIKLIDSNVRFSTYILECASQAKIKWFINTGTFWQNYQNLDYSPVNLYAASKQAFENIARFYIETKQIEFATLRLCDTYGPNDTRTKIFNLWCKIAKTGETLDMSIGDQIVDISYIDDIVDAYTLLADHLQINIPYVSNGSVYAVRAEKRYTLKQLAAVFEETTGFKLNINWGAKPYRFREVMIPWENGVIVPNWSPKITVIQGIRKLMSSFL